MQTTYARQSAQPRSESNDSSIEPGTSRRARSRPSPFKSRWNANGRGQGDRALVEALVSSKIFQEYEKAFSEATGLPVALRPVETWQLPHHSKRNEGPFCSLVSE